MVYSKEGAIDHHTVNQPQFSTSLWGWRKIRHFPEPAVHWMWSLWLSWLSLTFQYPESGNLLSSMFRRFPSGSHSKYDAKFLAAVWCGGSNASEAAGLKIRSLLRCWRKRSPYCQGARKVLQFSSCRPGSLDYHCPSAVLWTRDTHEAASVPPSRRRGERASPRRWSRATRWAARWFRRAKGKGLEDVERLSDPCGQFEHRTLG